jgi:hypothetical protein
MKTMFERKEPYSKMNFLIDLTDINSLIKAVSSVMIEANAPSHSPLLCSRMKYKPFSFARRLDTRCHELQSITTNKAAVFDVS